MQTRVRGPGTEPWGPKPSLITIHTPFLKVFMCMFPGLGEMITKLSSFIRSGPLFSLNVESGYQNWPWGPLFGVHQTWGYLGSFSANQTSGHDAVIFLRTFHKEYGHWQQGRRTIAGLHALCSLGHDQYDKDPQRPLAVPEASLSGGRVGVEYKQHSQLKRANYADSKKKKTFSKTPVGKFELPTAPQGHLELAVEPFLWISVKF